MNTSKNTARPAADATPDEARRQREEATEKASGADARAKPERDNDVKRESAERAVNAAIAARPAG